LFATSASDRNAAISGDGAYVAFTSYAPLVPGDTNGMTDVYVRNRVTNTTELVSISGAGEQGNWHSGPHENCIDISYDGRYVIFVSDASNLVPGDANNCADAFLRDRLTGATELISVSPTGAPGDHGGACSAISDDGRYVLFHSMSTNLVPDAIGEEDALFLRDRVSGTTEIITSTSSYTSFGWPSAISGDGRYVTWYEWHHGQDYDGLIGAFLKDRLTGVTETVSVRLDGYDLILGAVSDVSPGGRYVAFYAQAALSGSDRWYWQTFLRDRATGVTEQVSVSSNETQGWGDPWDEGGGNGGGTADPGASSTAAAGGPGLSADGRFVCFSSSLYGLIAESWQNPVLEAYAHVYLRDRSAGTTELVDVTRSGGFEPLQTACARPGNPISRDGRCIVFMGYSSELVPGDTNGWPDIFVRDLDARFHDVSSRYWTFPHIEACVAAGLVGGYPDNTYRPKLAVTRDQMAVYISRALAGGDALVPPGPATATFADVPNDQWAYKYVEYAVGQGVIGGYPDGTYQPTLTVTRDQMAVFVARAMAGGDASVPTGPATAFFPDVPTDHWAFRCVEYIRGEGVTGGYPDGTYRPTEACTRDQMAVYVQRAFALPM